MSTRPNPHPHCHGKFIAGHTLTEVVVALAIVAVVTIIAIPTFNRARENSELRDSALAMDSGIKDARGEAIRTGNVQIIFFLSDADGNTLTATDGTPVAALILDDGAPGSANQNCTIDAGETVTPIAGLSHIDIATSSGGSSGSGGSNDGGDDDDEDDDDDDDDDDNPGTENGSGETIPAPNESANSMAFTFGSTFVDPDGNNVNWTAFRPEGAPVAFDSACNFGEVGSGAGTVFVRSKNRAFAIELRPMGSTRILSYDASSGEWL